MTVRIVQADVGKAYTGTFPEKSKRALIIRGGASPIEIYAEHLLLARNIPIKISLIKITNNLT